MKQTLVGVGIAVGLMAVIVGVAVWSTAAEKNKYATLSTRDVALLCTTDMATEFHIHPHLEIIIDGVKQVIPANIGITPTCMNSIHTHDVTGTLHVEAPVKRDFMLDDFFTVWGKTFTKDQILDFKTDATHKITLTVNGAVVDTFENTVFIDKDQLVISYDKK